MDAPVQASLITAAGGLTVAVITGLWSYIAGKRQAANSATLAVHEGFKHLTISLQAERAELLKLSQEQAKEIVGLRVQVRQLEKKVDRILRAWRSGEAPPPMDNHDDDP